jgi:hypothetical protein
MSFSAAEGRERVKKIQQYRFFCCPSSSLNGKPFQNGDAVAENPFGSVCCKSASFGARKTARKTFLKIVRLIRRQTRIF